MLQLNDAIIFFDLAGTLVEVDGPLSDSGKSALRELGRRARRVVLITGQPFEDPQVREVLDVFHGRSAGDFVAYVTRGGLRLVWGNDSFVRDTVYLVHGRIDEALAHTVEEQIVQALTECGFRPRPGTSVRLIDDVAVRVNLDPANRPRFVTVLADRLAQIGNLDLQVLAEGRTSVFVTRRGLGKRRAVQYELDQVRQEGFQGQAYYFGNEFAEGGNDREVLGLPGLEAHALGPCGPLPPGVQCHTVGETPDDLYAMLRASSHQPFRGERPLPVVCLSLGGTKVEVGALTRAGTFLSSQEVHWRDSSAFVGLKDDPSVSHFCAALSSHIEGFLRQRGYDLSDIGVLGVPFPGPRRGTHWFSNNLIQPFQIGVLLEESLRTALRGPAGANEPPRVRVLFDAQCDAGGELYHPAGRLRTAEGEVPPSATVLNLATGIAAGFIQAGRVLLDDEDFRREVGPDYDGGAGQLGRHLWYHFSEGRWRYHFAPQGETPQVSQATRMTERLSGPALAARLLLRLDRDGLMPSASNWNMPGVPLERLVELAKRIACHDSGGDLTPAAQAVRSCPHPVAGALLRWADAVARDGAPSAVVPCIGAFVREAAQELAAALGAWMDVPAWEPFGRRIVLSGGVGIRFMASSDSQPEHSFLRAVAESLPTGCRVERSRLANATERECYLFLHQP